MFYILLTWTYFSVVPQCPNTNDTSTTDDGGFNITINNNTNSIPVEEVVTPEETEFCNDEYFTLSTNCQGGMARIMQVSLDVQNAVRVTITLVDLNGLPIESNEVSL